MKVKNSLNVKDFLSVLTIVLADENVSNSQELDKNKVQENLKILIKGIIQTGAMEGLYYLLKEPNSRAAKILLKKDLKKVLANNIELKNLALATLRNSDLLKDVKSINFINLNFSDSDNIIQIGNNNIAIGNARSLDVEIRNNNIYFELI